MFADAIATHAQDVSCTWPSVANSSANRSMRRCEQAYFAWFRDHVRVHELVYCCDAHAHVLLNLASRALLLTTIRHENHAWQDCVRTCACSIRAWELLHGGRMNDPGFSCFHAEIGSGRLFFVCMHSVCWHHAALLIGVAPECIRVKRIRIHCNR
jgi:hypothetical protein